MRVSTGVGKRCRGLRGLIKEWWQREDNLAFMTQLGMKLGPGDSAG
jgi:hypothetical protein